MAQAFPMRRQRGLLVHDLPDEVLVYDIERHEAHCLNRSAALIWRQCDGATAPAAMVRPLEGALGVAIDEDVVEHGLDQLATCHLLEEESPARVPSKGLGRRDLILRVGLAVGVGVPLVSSIVAPVSAQVVSGPAPTGPTGPNGTGGFFGSTGSG